MKLREITNPTQVYDGYFESYFIRPFFHHYADFRGRESGRSCLLSLVTWLIVTMGIAGIMMGQVGILGPEVGFQALYVVGVVWVALSVVPLLSLLVRTANGSPERRRATRFLGVDTLLLVSCLLFFLLGLLMMLTTVNSGSLDPNSGAYDEVDTTSLEFEQVTEEPIFTYQDITPVSPEPVHDTLGDMTEQDLAPVDESYDPTLDAEAKQDLDASGNSSGNEEEADTDSVYF